MPIHVRTQILSKFSRPGRQHYAQEGDFAEVSGLYPDYTRNKLKRAPAWSAHVPWPEEATTFEGFTACNVVITSPDDNYFMFYGKLTTPTNHLAVVQWDRDAKALADKYDMTLDLGAYTPCSGYHGRAAIYFAGDLFIVSLNYDLYFGSNLTAQPSDSYAGTFGVVVAYGDKVFLADKNQGLIYRLNEAATDFELYYTPRTYLKVQAIFPYHQYLCVIAKQSDGRIGVYRIPDIYVQTAHEIGHIPNSTGRYASGSQYSAGNPYAAVGDLIYILTGYQNPAESPLMGLYSFDGTRIRHVCDVTDIPAQADCQSMGLLDWRGNLILWALDDTLTTHTLKSVF